MKSRFRTGLVAFLLGVAASSCTYYPNDGGYLEPGDDSTFFGFSIAPSATIEIQAKTPGTTTWTTIATTSASATPYVSTSPVFSRALYPWEKPFHVPAGYFSGNQVTLRARQQTGSSFSPTYMYDPEGFDCLLDRHAAAASAGTTLDVDAAGADCSDGRFEVTLVRQ